MSKHIYDIVQNEKQIKLKNKTKSIRQFAVYIDFTCIILRNCH